MEDRNAFEALFKDYYMQLFCFARGMVSDEEECRDIVVTAYESVWKRFEDIDESTVKAYLYRTVRNNCLNYISHQQLEKKYADYYRTITNDVTTEDGLVEHQERTQMINKVLGAMNPTTRDILISCYVEGKKYKDVAAEREISISTVKKHMVAALKKIRELRLNKV